MKSFILKLILGISILSSCSSYYASRVDGPYKGKVVDAETGQPIAGVVVLGTWYRQFPSPGGAVSKYYDAKETVTDKNGDFEIKGLGRLIMSNIIPMDVLIFKAGYEYIGMGPWESLKLDGGLLEHKVAWEGDRAIIPLRKLTMEERRNNIPPLPPGEAPYNKIKLMLGEYNKNTKDLGLGIIDVWRNM